MGGERAVYGTPIRTRSRGAARGLLMRRSSCSRHIPSGTGCVRKLSATSTDPANRRQAMADDAVGWAAAECKEVLNHLSNRSWEYISHDDLPHGRKLVRLIWVYQRKRDGSLKARLCVQGCSQVPGVDYHQPCTAKKQAL